MKHRVAIALAALIAAGCTQTSIQNSWRDPDDSGPAFRKVMVVGVTARADVRRTFEDGFVAELKSAGVAAVPSYVAEPDLGLDWKDKLRAAVKTAGVDGLLVTRLVRRERQSQSTPGTRTVPPMAMDVEIVTAEVNAFRTATDKLAWAGTSETFVSSDIAKSTRDFAKVVISALAKDRLL